MKKIEGREKKSGHSIFLCWKSLNLASYAKYIIDSHIRNQYNISNVFGDQLPLAREHETHEKLSRIISDINPLQPFEKPPEQI